MPLLHAAGADIMRRLESLTAASPRRWGTMSVDQMLWHVNQTMEMAIGRYRSSAAAPPLPRWLMKLMLLTLPWPKGAPTGPDLVARQQFDVSEERTRALRLIEELMRKSMDGPWPEHPAVGPLTGREWSHLMHKHLDHHLRQFSC